MICPIFLDDGLEMIDKKYSIFGLNGGIEMNWMTEMDDLSDIDEWYIEKYIEYLELSWNEMDD